MKTTLNKIREHSPCRDGWEKLLKTLGKTKADDEELSLLTILNSNGIEDAIWCFRAIEGHNEEIGAFARFCAMQNIDKIKPYCSEENYDLIIDWLETGNDDIRLAARSAARSAADSAARSAARSAAWSSAWSAADSAADSAARSAARSAAWSSAWSSAWSEQETELRRIIGKDYL